MDKRTCTFSCMRILGKTAFMKKLIGPRIFCVLAPKTFVRAPKNMLEKRWFGNTAKFIEN